MGIPRFYRWLSERYPLINEQITAEQIPDFDNLYLDMNGIIHNCSHANTGGLCVNDENDVFVEAFKYIARLVHIIKPKKLLYMAIDGCAPRAKMNQQRSRRFRAANEAREAREKAEAMGDAIEGTPFDSNCITPGTEFMAKLTTHLQFFVYKKIQEDPLWQGITVILSGPDVPGEGEHKIVDYIRRCKAQPDYPPDLRHCMYGLDADLIMLALASHEPHFALLREEVVFGRQQTENVEQRMFMQKDRFQLLHISLVREYLDLEFGSVAKNLSFEYDLERVIDDFILFCVLVGNDFLPHLPFSEIGDGGLDKFIRTYKEHLEKASSKPPWLTQDCGNIAWDQFDIFLKQYALIEKDKLRSIVEEEGFVLGRRRRVGPASSTNVDDMESANLHLDHPPNSDLARVQYYEVKFGINIQVSEGLQRQCALFKSYLEGLQWVMRYYYRGPDDASWSWYYPYYHAPMISDLVNYSELGDPKLQFDIGEPFKPFQQLMAVLPSNSKNFLPECYRWLFDSPSSPILSFYPSHFEIDVDGVTVPWGGVTLIPFIDPAALLDAMRDAERRGPKLSEAEQKRNSFHCAMAFNFDLNACHDIHSSMPDRFRGIQRCAVTARDFHHLAVPSSGYVNRKTLLGSHAHGFPLLHSYDLTTSFESGVKVFQFEARGQSLIVHVHPASPCMPDEKNISRLMKQVCVQIDYPCVHLGKIVAVHTAEKSFLANGKTAANNARDHENLVRQLTTDLRRKGLSVHFVASKHSKDDFLQPVAEVKPVEWTFIDSAGQVQFQYKKATEYRLLHLVQAYEVVHPHKRRSITDRFPVGSSVLYTDPENELFGQTGVVVRSGEDSQIESRFERGLSHKEQQELQYRIQCIVQQQHQSLKWYNLSKISKAVGLPEYVLRSIFGSLMMRSPDNVREDMGMNLIHEAKKDGSAHCLPAFSMKSAAGWCFSDLAVEAVTDYASKYPELIEALLQRWTNDRDLEASWIFWQSPDASYSFNKMIKYVKSCAFKKLRFVPVQYMALTPATISEIALAVDEVYKRMVSRPAENLIIKGCSNIYRAEDQGSCPAPGLLSRCQELELGQRVVYIKPHGLVPCGAKGTLVAIYGTGVLQECEVLLDEDSFGSTNLHGRAPSMRGTRALCSSFMPLPPSTGILASSLSAPLPGSMDNSSSRAQGSDGNGKSNGKGHRCLALNLADSTENSSSRAQGFDGYGKSNGKGHRGGGNSSKTGGDAKGHRGGGNGKSNGLEPPADAKNSSLGASYWETKFEELINLGCAPSPGGG